jgi:hypothetical protein
VRLRARHLVLNRGSFHPLCVVCWRPSSLLVRPECKPRPRLGLGPWFLHHGCVHLEEAGSQVTALPHENGEREPQSAATKLRRMLRPGGVLLVTATNADDWRHRLDRAARQRPRRPAMPAPTPCGACCSRALASPVSKARTERSSEPALGWTPREGRSSSPYRVAERFFPSQLGSRYAAFATRSDTAAGWGSGAVDLVSASL